MTVFIPYILKIVTALKSTFSFVTSLLRNIVQNVHMKNYPEGMMGPAEADRIIESLAPDILEGWLRQKIDAREIG